MFETSHRVTYSQVKDNLHVDMPGIVNLLQDCSIAHSSSVGKGPVEASQLQRAWFVSGWQIEVLRYPVYNEEITIRVWPHGYKGMYGYRNCDIVDKEGNVIVKANSIWIFMDLTKMRPAKIKPEDIEGYIIEPALEMEYAPRKINKLDSQYEIETSDSPVEIKWSFLDSNQHVNNARYVEEAFNLLSNRKEIKKMRVDYRMAAVLGDIMYPSQFQHENVHQVVFSDKEGNPFVLVECM